MTTNDKDLSVQGSVLDKYVQQPTEADESQPIITECYTEMPTHVAMLDFIDTAGNHTALPYHALEEAQFNPSEGIILKFHGQQVKLTGQNLKQVYDRLTYQRVRRIEAAHRGNFENSDELVVTNIRISKNS